MNISAIVSHALAHPGECDTLTVAPHVADTLDRAMLADCGIQVVGDAKCPPNTAYLTHSAYCRVAPLPHSEDR